MGLVAVDLNMYVDVDAVELDGGNAWRCGGRGSRREGCRGVVMMAAGLVEVAGMDGMSGFLVEYFLVANFPRVLITCGLLLYGRCFGVLRCGEWEILLRIRGSDSGIRSGSEIRPVCCRPR